MAENEVIITTRVEGGDESAAEIKKLDDGIKQTGEASEEATVKLNKLEEETDDVTVAIKKASDALDKQITDIKKSSDSTEIQIQKLKGMRDALVAGSSQFETFGTKGAAGATAITAAINRVDAELQQLDAAVVSSPFERQMENWERAVADVQKRFDTTGQIVPRDIAKIQRAQEALNIVLNESETELDELGAAAKARYQQMESATEQAIVRARSLKDAVDDQNDKLKEGGVAWAGMEDAMNKALGKYGAIQMQIVATSAAFMEGIRMGNQFNAAIGTDMSEANKLYAEWGEKTRVIIERLSDSFIALWKLQVAAFDFGAGYQERMKAAIEDVRTSTAALGGDIEAEIALRKKQQEEIKERTELEQKQAGAAKTAAGETVESQQTVQQQLAATLAAQQASTAATLAAERAVTLTKNAEGQWVIQNAAGIAAKNADKAATDAVKTSTDAATASLVASKAPMDALIDGYGKVGDATEKTIEKINALPAAIKAAMDALNSEINSGVAGLDRFTAAAERAANAVAAIGSVENADGTGAGAAAGASF